MLFFVFSTLWYFSVGLPDYKKLSNYQPPISSRVYSEDSKLIAEYAIEKRLFIPFEAVPDKIVNSNAERDIFSEYKFTAENTPQFNSFMIKVVMTSTSQAKAPRIKNFRSVALRSFEIE